ncbi:hypothetical protein HanIR_Chr12g0573771 [Helianthus annuus]|nr:hypothetical protein HanIR_Chr12g0573771 [Helianthus annuus]
MGIGFGPSPTVADPTSMPPSSSSSRPRLHRRHTDVQDDPNGGAPFVCLFVCEWRL